VRHPCRTFETIRAIYAVRADLRAAFPVLPARELERWAATAPEVRSD